MKVVLAFDKFKGSATARQLMDAVRDCLDSVEGLELVCVPVADGGDGTVDVLAAACQGQWVTVPTMGPLLQQAPVTASYFLCDDGTALTPNVYSGTADALANTATVVTNITYKGEAWKGTLAVPYDKLVSVCGGRLQGWISLDPQS